MGRQNRCTNYDNVMSATVAPHRKVPHKMFLRTTASVRQMASVKLMSIRKYFACTQDRHRLPSVFAATLAVTGAFAQTNATLETKDRKSVV